MKSTPKISVLALSLLLATLPATASFAADQPELLVAGNANASTTAPQFVTGGVGDDERETLENARLDYNVHIMNAQADGAFVDATSLTISDAKGNPLFVEKAGPMFYVNLAPGKYMLTAENAGRKQTKRITVGKAQNNTYFLWK